MDLGWVDFDLNVPSSCKAPQPKFPAAQADLGRKWNAKNQCLQNPGPRPPAPPCNVVNTPQYKGRFEPSPVVMKKLKQLTKWAGEGSLNGSEAGRFNSIEAFIDPLFDFGQIEKRIKEDSSM